MSQQRTDLQGEREGRTPGEQAPSRMRWLLAGGGVAVAAAVSIFLATRTASEPTPDPRPPPAPASAPNVDISGEPSTIEKPSDVVTEAAPPKDMVRIEGGATVIGSSYSPRFKMALPESEATVASFWIDAFEAHGEDRMPLANVPLEQAQRHCEKLGKRLPTEVEWEVAARRGTLSEGRFRVAKKSERGAATVGTHAKDKTSDGVFDLLGNVAEWTATRWEGDLSKNIVRGSSFNVSNRGSFNSSIHARVPVSQRDSDIDIGFRCASSDPVPPGVK